MKKILLSTLILTLFIVSIVSQSSCCDRTTVTVRGDGETKIKPNLAIITVSFTADGKTSKQALQKLNTQLNDAQKSLQSNGVNKNDISSTYISLYPKYDYTNGTKIVGYTITVTLTITIRGIDKDSGKIVTIIDGIGAKGVTSIYGITYDTVDPNAGKMAARKMAWDDALNKAKQYAMLSGKKLGKVISIQQTNQLYTPIFYRSDNNLEATAKNQLPPGQIIVTIFNYITWQLV